MFWSKFSNDYKKTVKNFTVLGKFYSKRNNQYKETQDLIKLLQHKKRKLMTCSSCR